MATAAAASASASHGFYKDISPLKLWFCRNKMFLKRNNHDPETHLLLDGGRILVPDNMNDNFLEKYAECIKENDRVYAVERRTECFNYFMEFDYHSEEQVDGALLAIHIGSILQRDFIAKYVSVPTEFRTTLLVSYCPCVEESDNSYKTGIHFNWQFPVRVNLAKQLRILVLNKFNSITKEDLGFCLPHNPWSEVIDASVYNHCGLRLLYSRKNVPCKTCGGNPFKRKHADCSSDNTSIIDAIIPCNSCSGTGKQDIGRVYKVVCVIDNTGEVDRGLSDRCHSDVAFAVKCASIRNCTTKPETCATLKDDAFNDEEMSTLAELMMKDEKPKGRGKRKKKGLDEDIALTKAFLGDSEDKIPMDEILMNDPRAMIICTFIEKSFDHNPVVVSLKYMNRRKCKADDEKTELFYIASTRCKYCQNKGGEHTSAFVYFIITQNGVYQKCFSRKTVVYPNSNKTCEQFKSQPKKMDKHDLTQLFTKYAQKSEKKAIKKKQWIDAMYKRNANVITEEFDQPATQVPVDDVPLPPRKRLHRNDENATSDIPAHADANQNPTTNIPKRKVPPKNCLNEFEWCLTQSNIRGKSRY
ncbi:MAG: herpesvirus-type DNA primase [Methylococcales bacterium]|nr:herpesvirus-type DNA primase [Methylococcales bacterium]